MIILWLLVLAFWVIFSFGVASQARAKGRSYLAFLWISLFISPILAFIIVASMAAPGATAHNQSVQANTGGSGDLVKCPQCAELIKVEANVCRYCQSDVRSHMAAIRLEQEELSQRQSAIVASHLEEKFAQLQLARDEAAAREEAARKKQSEFMRSKRFLIPAGSIGVVLIGTIVAIAIQTSSSNAAWSTAQVQWTNILGRCNMTTNNLSQQTVFFDSSDNFNQVESNWPWTPGHCAFFYLTGSVSASGSISDVHVDSAKYSVTWTPSWSTSKVAANQKLSAPLASALAGKLTDCIGADGKATLTSTTLEVTEKALGDIPGKNAATNWLPNNAKCFLGNISQTSSLNSLLTKEATWTKSRTLHVVDSDMGAAWEVANPQPNLPVVIDGGKYFLYLRPTFNKGDGSPATATNYVHIGLFKTPQSGF